jgi:predicted transcriptional regulator of viral defense system
MTYDDLVTLTGKLGWFDLATLVQMSAERRDSLQVQLHRWRKSGKLLPLRRGMYALPERYRTGKLSSVELANGLHMPSYLSSHWALGYYGMIPEHVVEFTSVTSRGPRRYQNSFGLFTYRHVKPAAFFGYRSTDMNDARILIAEPEKALLDLWHLHRGEWTIARMTEMRFQAFEQVLPSRLQDYALRYASPRLERALRSWLVLVDQRHDAGDSI